MEIQSRKMHKKESDRNKDFFAADLVRMTFVWFDRVAQKWCKVEAANIGEDISTTAAGNRALIGVDYLYTFQRSVAKWQDRAECLHTKFVCSKH